MNDTDYEIDPNAPTENQSRLKRVETAIRRRASCHLLLKLDEIAFVHDRGAQMLLLKQLKTELAS
ncbi:hypothetical protein R70006_05003 [Paraburkholderia domus]|uniref:hypothetical protein n=1 Tax=Paraburkholderia domus TaxID=2793075 RepID=UPI001911ED68|nr:hypothetical protein [Paraburkholderia domus]MBK5051761.1 hypothetical protein [Burkholderia sp. R-70006]CAE6794435.1 hypothetical protein R70006_05003 [Paraburkholderia domus]